MPEYGFFLTRICPYKERILDQNHYDRINLNCFGQNQCSTLVLKKFLTHFRSSRSQMFFKVGVLKSFGNSQGNTCVGVIFNKVVGPQALFKRDSKTDVFL